jgi:lipopolysaccharide/colanic/teichoic acid biosynthesis glycosyltransferase
MKYVVKRNESIVKVILDKFFSIILLILLFPLFLIIGVLIKLDSKGPVFFIQKRVGKDGKIFRAYKLRTMVENAEKFGLGHEIEKNDSRITRVGKYLRWGIDELPQLINVFKGEMSLVGPRPTLLYQVNQYTKREKQRLKMKPGITGWALINGRNSLSWQEKINLDIWYINHFSLYLDIKILIKTLFVVAEGKNLYENNK